MAVPRGVGRSPLFHLFSPALARSLRSLPRALGGGTVGKKVQVWEMRQCWDRGRDGGPERWSRSGLEVGWGHLRQATADPGSP